MAQCEDVFGLIVARQGLDEGLFVVFDTRLAMPGEHARIAFAGYDIADDEHAGHTGRLAEHLVELEIHHFQRLVHPQYLFGGSSSKCCTMPPISTHFRNLLGRKEATLQQAKSMQLAKPPAIPYIGLATRDVLGMAGIDQANVKAGIHQYLVGRDPIDTCRFHDYVADTAIFQPGSHRMEVDCEAAKRADRLLVAVLTHRNLMGFRTDVDSGCIPVHCFKSVKDRVISLLTAKRLIDIIQYRF